MVWCRGLSRVVFRSPFFKRPTPAARSGTLGRDSAGTPASCNRVSTARGTPANISGSSGSCPVTVISFLHGLGRDRSGFQNAAQPGRRRSIERDNKGEKIEAGGGTIQRISPSNEGPDDTPNWPNRQS